MRKKEFSNFNLLEIQYPFTAIVSILHRITGIIVFLFIPYLLWLLDNALTSEEGFYNTSTVLTQPMLKIILWIFLSTIWYHLIAGIRHMLMDVGVGEELRSGRASGVIVMVSTIILSIFMAWWLW